MSYKTIDQQLYEADIAISNGIDDPHIRAALEGYEYTLERMKEGKSLVETAGSLNQLVNEAKYRQAETWKELQTLFQAGLDVYRSFRAVSRQALRGQEDLLASLSLGAETHRTLSRWLDQARIFYTNSLENKEISDAFQIFGVKPKMLKDALKEVEKIEEVEARHKRRKAETHRAVKKRDQAVLLVKEWMIPYMNICRIALAGQPEQLGKLKYK